MDPRVVKSIPVAGQAGRLEEAHCFSLVSALLPSRARGVLPWSLRFDRTAAGIEATGDIGRLP